ncbi:MAG: type II secretion system protein [Candidatus Uhrbacteria bacterium]|nr:type II secretion system protein [Candidatus Uhrbacteria bacterium]
MNKQGITKIEVLIVALIIGLLGLMAVVAVSTARSRTRDAIRLSDVRQTQAALELYFNDFNMYPEVATETALGGASTICLGESGFASACMAQSENVYMDVVPGTPTAGLNKLSGCSDVSNAYCYVGSVGEYRIQFELEHANPLIELQKGLNCATESGIEPGQCSVIIASP